MRVPTLLPFSALFAATCLLSGCGVDVVSTSSSPSPLAIHGSVYGGSQPIGSAHIYLYAANTTGYGGNGIAPSALNGSISLLTAGKNTTADGSGNYYVTSGTDGSFTISGDYTACAAGASTQVYLYAIGGDPGTGSNSAIGLLAALGSCTTLSNSTQVTLNEATTIAAAYSFAAFATDPTHVSSSGTPLAQVGLANAFLTAPTLTSLAAGAPINSSSYYYTGETTASVAALANILASCVNSVDTISGSTVTHSANCTALFSNATPPGSPTSLPSDTAVAAINLAHTLDPTTAQLQALNALQPATGAPFAGAQTLSALTLSIVYVLNPAEPFAQTGSVAIDGNGNVWLQLYDQSQQKHLLDGITTTGTPLAGSPFFGDGQSLVDGPLVIDRYNNIWIGDSVNSGISEFTNNGSPAAGSPFAAGDSGRLAFDGAGYLWSVGTNLIKLTASGSPVAGASYPLPSGLGSPAIDGAGSIWGTTASNSQNYVTKISNNGQSTSTFTAPADVTNRAGGGIDSAGNYWFSNTTTQGPPLTTSITYGLFSNSGAISGPYLVNASIFTSADSLVSPLQFVFDGSGLGWSGYGIFSSTGQISGVAATTPQSDALAYLSSQAIDGSGNVWITGAFGQVQKLIGVAAPVITPLCAGLPATFTANGSSNLGTRP